MESRSPTCSAMCLTETPDTNRHQQTPTDTLFSTYSSSDVRWSIGVRLVWIPSDDRRKQKTLKKPKYDRDPVLALLDQLVEHKSVGFSRMRRVAVLFCDSLPIHTIHTSALLCVEKWSEYQFFYSGTCIEVKVLQEIQRKVTSLSLIMILYKELCQCCGSSSDFEIWEPWFKSILRFFEQQRSMTSNMELLVLKWTAFDIFTIRHNLL